MTKKELMVKYEELLGKVGMGGLYGISWKSNKADLQNAIDCLSLTDEQLDDYFTVMKLAYPNLHRVISEVGNWKKHSNNRLYVYNTARLALMA
jgi:hypothetical protein